MEDFPALASSPPNAAVGKKRTDSRRQQQASYPQQDSFKQLAKFLEEGEKSSWNGAAIRQAEDKLESTSTGVVYPLDETISHTGLSKKQNKTRKKTKFIPLDLGKDKEVGVVSQGCPRNGTTRRRYGNEVAVTFQQHLSEPLPKWACSDYAMSTTDALAKGSAKESHVHSSIEQEENGENENEHYQFNDRLASFESPNSQCRSLTNNPETLSNEREILYRKSTKPVLENSSRSLQSGKRLCSTTLDRRTECVPPISAHQMGEKGRGSNDTCAVKRGKKYKPAPSYMLGFKTKRQPHTTKQPSPKKDIVHEQLKVPETKPNRRKQRERRTLIIPTIESDGSDSTEETHDVICGREYCGDTEELDTDSLTSLDSKHSAVIGLTLARCSDVLVHLLTQKKVGLKEGLVLISLISKGCTCNVIRRSGSQVLSQLQHTNVLSEFLHYLSKEMNTNIHTIDSFKLQSFFDHVMKILHAQKITSRGGDASSLPRLLLMSLAKRWKDFLGNCYDRIILDLQTLKEVKAEESAAAFLTTDESFRKVPIIPKNEDINPHIKPSLKGNKVKGRYSNVDEYLDLQFRLLREDFIQPLREGISEYQDLMRQKDRKALRLYQNVKVKRILCSENGIVYRLQFDVSKLSHVDWNNTKRLMYGSMVCISTDKFVTVRFATVSDRKAERLQQGKVDVKFDSKVKLDSKTVFAMVETPALFEAYRHILQGLQNIDASTLAFQRYFVECQNLVYKPQYLTRRYSSHYDLTELISGKNKNTAESLESDDTTGSEESADFCNIVDILSDKHWPTAEYLCMDDSQFRAFHTALTKELAIIQGPPGTGKTYVGLKIMKALLTNMQAWNPDLSRPLLVVCYTNHALDQFLEGIVSFFKGDVLRVGGRSKNEKMFNHNLNRRRLDLFRKRNTLDDDISDILEIRQKLRDDFIVKQREIEELGQQIDATASGILHEDQLKPFMKQHYRQIKKFAERAPSALLEWLDVKGVGKSIQDGKRGKDTMEKMEISDDEEEDEIIKQRKVDDTDEVLKKETVQLSSLRQQCLAFNLADCDLTDKAWKQKHDSNMRKASRQTLKTRIRKELIEVTRMDQQEAENVTNILTLPAAEKWKLYRFWVEEFCHGLHHLMEPLKTECQNAADRYKEANGLVDKYIFEHSSVIGMTTTGAARYHSILSDIQPPVIIVEEAAEVLEGHIVTSLSPGCQHLILIGDHQQLRPSPNVYELAQRYNLDLSLFERMINNGLHCDTLELQHRMRPSISRVMKHIYKQLKDHESVLTYENIMGISENIFFINHNVPETENTELLSHLNVFEADYMTQLCRYLLKQGYKPSQITVLSTYSAQVSRLRSLMREESRDGVLITAVDNYQGEENDIILLSLVRSNKEKKIGFLNIDNRICVALSRARKGLYVIGNFDLLSSQSQTWKNIVEDMKRSKQIGPGPELYCQTHPGNKRVVVKDLGMFSLVPEGGCLKPCEFVLNCGHRCRKKCHAYDPMHENYDCLEPCQKRCPKGHQCPGKCSEECNPCEVLVAKTLPRCGHTDQVECSLDPKEHKCQQACDQILECGHKCGNICSYDHICYDTVKKEWPCGHVGDVLCIDKDTIACQSKCTTKLLCGHICQGTCEECSGGRLHIPCTQDCQKVLVCGHECRSSCSRCPPCTVACENSCQHGKCNEICGEKCKLCLEPCTWSCSNHKCLKKCSEPCDRRRCDNRCRKLLKCKHACIGLCGEKCPSYCRNCNKDDLRAFLPDSEDISTARFIHLEDCGHIVEVKTLDNIFDTLDNHSIIKLPCCPWCSTPIRHNARYGRIIKSVLKHIELAKTAYLDIAPKRVEELRMRIQDDLETIDRRKEVSKLFQEAGRDLDYLTALKSQTEFVLKLAILEGKLDESNRNFCKEIIQDIECFKNWLYIKRKVFSLQEESDAQSELSRIHTALLLEYMSSSVECHDDMEEEDLSLFLEKVETVKKDVADERIFTAEQKAAATDLIKKWLQLYPDRAVELEDWKYEKVQGWRSISMEQGHWRTCQKSLEHVFCTEDMEGNAIEGCPICEAIQMYDSDESNHDDDSDDD